MSTIVVDKAPKDTSGEIECHIEGDIESLIDFAEKHGASHSWCSESRAKLAELRRAKTERDDLFVKDLNDWIAMLKECAKLSDLIHFEDVGMLEDWGSADEDTLLEQFDPWAVLREIQTLLASTGVVRIARERARQVSVEGWTPEHDDQHKHGEMALAAACYAGMSRESDAHNKGNIAACWWPEEWDWRWCKPKDAESDLSRSGALAAAEIDRLLRKTQNA